MILLLGMMVLSKFVSCSKWSDVLKDEVAFINNPIEAGLPSHWIPVSIVKRIVEMRVQTISTPQPQKNYNDIFPKKTKDGTKKLKLTLSQGKHTNRESTTKKMTSSINTQTTKNVIKTTGYTEEEETAREEQKSSVPDVHEINKHSDASSKVNWDHTETTITKDTTALSIIADSTTTAESPSLSTTTISTTSPTFMPTTITTPLEMTTTMSTIDTPTTYISSAKTIPLTEPSSITTSLLTSPSTTPTPVTSTSTTTATPTPTTVTSTTPLTSTSTTTSPTTMTTKLIIPTTTPLLTTTVTVTSTTDSTTITTTDTGNPFY
ncbi:uncharacterized protein [Epargyreus clarus]|uniref:uncharacterized protein n=1 Tax=Epargyreus clarus TaxID=520877 RepID=UPI003C2F00D8